MNIKIIFNFTEFFNGVPRNIYYPRLIHLKEEEFFLKHILFETHFPNG